MISSQAMDDLIVSKDIQKHSVKVVINQAFKTKYLTDNFFASYDDDIDLTTMDESIALMPFYLNIVTVVWISGQTYSVDAMDEDLYNALKKIKKVFQRMYPRTKWKGDIVPKKVVKNKSTNGLKDPNKEIAMLYSGGLDSIASSIYHMDKKQLLITLWGQNDVPLYKPALWKTRKKEFLDYAQKNGYSNSFVKSNYVDFLNRPLLEHLSPEIRDWRVDGNEGIGMAGLAAPILFAKGYSRLYIASSFTWDYPYANAANPLVDDNITFANGIHAKHDLFDYTRFDKLAFLAKLRKEKNIEIPTMKSCAGKRDHNCCFKCAKCSQTIMALLFLEEDPKKYSFKMATTKTVPLAQQRMQELLGYWERWNWLVLQKEIQKKLTAGLEISQPVRWLLDRDPSHNVMVGLVKYKDLSHWQDFQDLAPEGLIIPPCKPLLLNYKNKYHKTNKDIKS